jgi:hypothetical protein
MSTYSTEMPRQAEHIQPPPTIAQKAPVGQGLLIIVALQSHSDTPHSVGQLRMSDQPIAQTST